jgi:hypothetical protein
MTADGKTVVFTGNRCYIYRNGCVKVHLTGKPVATATLDESKLYAIDQSIPELLDEEDKQNPMKRMS